MIKAGLLEGVTYRGKAWSDNCREWVYFNCFIDTAAVRGLALFCPSASSTTRTAAPTTGRSVDSFAPNAMTPSWAPTNQSKGFPSFRG